MSTDASGEVCVVLTNLAGTTACTWNLIKDGDRIIFLKPAVIGCWGPKPTPDSTSNEIENYGRHAHPFGAAVFKFPS